MSDTAASVLSSAEKALRAEYARNAFAKLAASSTDHRQSAFEKVKVIIALWGEIPQTKPRIKGLGAKSWKRLVEIRDTGKLVEVEENPEECGGKTSSKDEAIRRFTTVPEIGRAKATELVDTFGDSITVKDLETREDMQALLHYKQKLGVKYQQALVKRIKRAKVVEYGEVLKKLVLRVNKNLEVFMAGSARRGAKTCGDMDFLLVTRGLQTSKKVEKSTILPRIMAQLGDENVGVLGAGRKKASFLLNWPIGSKHVHHVDLRLVPYNSLGAALLYFTGNAEFNVVLRQHAKNRGYKLNEYALTPLANPDSKKIFKTEEEILAELGLPFIEPKNRTPAFLQKLLSKKASAEDAGTSSGKAKVVGKAKAKKKQLGSAEDAGTSSGKAKPAGKAKAKKKQLKNSLDREEEDEHWKATKESFPSMKKKDWLKLSRTLGDGYPLTPGSDVAYDILCEFMNPSLVLDDEDVAIYSIGFERLFTAFKKSPEGKQHVDFINEVEAENLKDMYEDQHHSIEDRHRPGFAAFIAYVNEYV